MAPAAKKKVGKKKGPAKKAGGPEPELHTFFENTALGIVQTSTIGVQSLDGKVVYAWPEEDIHFEGPMEGSTIMGEGTMTWPDGSTYEGGLHTGQREGHGVLTRADVARYEGQWKQGRREGVGRMTYDAQAECHYTGQWADGKKHGSGTRVWPSGNFYEGDWHHGEMSGYGEMRWSHGDMYKGTWQNGVPDGDGEYVWASSCTSNEEQQARNRYRGQWKDGKRHGEGTFIYANGARFEGQWVEGKKHGEGKVTFQDGNVYEGSAFRGDWVTGRVDRLSVPIVPKAVLDYGFEDNPTRQLIRIVDTLFLEQPYLGDLDEDQKETHNILLRALGPIKQVYYKYRKVLRREGEDPYQLTTLQLRCFLRDHGLVTPTTSYALIDRSISQGVRYHLEHCPTLLDDFNTLSTSKTEVRKRKQQWGIQRESVESTATERQHRAREEDPNPCSLPREKSCAYYAADSSQPCDDIHGDDHPILLRHFFEILVRVAIIRFPDLPKIHHRVEKLVSEHVLPKVESPPASLWVFTYATQAIKAELAGRLMQVFYKLGEATNFPPRGASEEDLPAKLPVDIMPETIRPRQASVLGRKDTTLRIKDLFRLLHALGLLRPKYGSDEVTGQLTFPTLPEAYDSIIERLEEEERVRVAQVQGLLSAQFTGSGTLLERFGDGEDDSRLKALLTDAEIEMPVDRESAVVCPYIDWTLSPTEALQIAVEPMTQEFVLQLSVAPTNSSMMELMEYELTAGEFLRFFYVYTKRRLRKAPEAEDDDSPPTNVLLNKLLKEFFEEMEDHEIFDLFLRVVFFPAFEKARVPSLLPEEREPADRPPEPLSPTGLDIDASMFRENVRHKILTSEAREHEEESDWGDEEEEDEEEADKPPERNYIRNIWPGVSTRETRNSVRRIPERLKGS